MFKFSNQSAGSSTLHPHLTIISPFMLPFIQISIVRKFNKWNVTRKVKQAIQRLGFHSPVLITSVPQACDFVKSFEDGPSIYYCVDEFSLWPGLNQSLVKQMEKLLLSKVDLVLATSQSLVDSKKSTKGETKLLTHGVDAEHFNIGPKIDSEKKVVCYFGLFDQRTNLLILEHIALKFPHVELRIIGECLVDVSFFQQFENVTFVSKVKYEDLPGKIGDVDVFLLPYKVDEFTKFINPLKLKEYLATGRPVLATSLPEVLNLKEYLYIAETENDFCRILSMLLDGEIKYDSQKTLDFIRREETWMAKAETVAEHFQN